MKTAFSARRLYTPLDEIENALLSVEDGVITGVSSRAKTETSANVVDFGDAIIAPGFIDIHIHGGAGLDVYDREPHVDPRLLGCPRLVLAPHIGSATTEARTQMAQLCADAVIAVLTGHRPPNLVVDPTASHEVRP